MKNSMTDVSVLLRRHLRWLIGIPAALAIGLGLAGCASGPAASGSSARSSGVEVFGTIDASVSGTVNKSGR